MVDLPGYGYAKASKSEIKRWTDATRDFLKGRAVLKRVFVLIDSRHGMKENDLPVLAELDKAAVNYQIILTKTDKLKPNELEKVVGAAQEVIKKRPAAHPHIICVSAHTNVGITQLRDEIMTLI